MAYNSAPMPEAAANETLNLQIKIAEWRQKARAGTMSQEDLAEAIKVLRAGRQLIAAATGGAKTNRTAKAAAAKPQVAELLSQLEGL